MKKTFKDFLKNKKIYFKCVKHWEKLIKDSLPSITFKKYFKTTFNNGEDFLDGNPIFNFKDENSNKAVFIIQEEAESKNVYFKSYIDKFETESETIEKLVIVLELSEESEQLAINLIKKWIL